MQVTTKFILRLRGAGCREGWTLSTLSTPQRDLEHPARVGPLDAVLTFRRKAKTSQMTVTPPSLRILQGIRNPLPGAPAVAEIFIPAIAEALAKRPHDATAAVYSWFDATRTSLYIGSTDALISRTQQHIRSSTWTQFAAEASVRWFPTLRLARLAETEEINVRVPLFNVSGNPRARAALVRYLMDQDRPDLLVPNISRG